MLQALTDISARHNVAQAVVMKQPTAHLNFRPSGKVISGREGNGPQCVRRKKKKTLKR